MIRRKGVKRRTDEADAELYRSVAPELVRYATMLVGPADAHDVVANAIIAAMSSRQWPTVNNRRSYLFRATTSKAQDHFRAATSRRKREETASRLFVERWVGEAQEEVVEAVAGLSPRQRAVIHLTYWEDLTPSAVAELLGISDGAVRQHLTRARTHLRAALAPIYGPREDTTR